MVDVDESAGLVEEDCGEGYAKFGGDYGEAAFIPLVFGIEVFDRLPALGVVAFRDDLLIHERDMPVFELLVEMCDFVGFIQVNFTKLFDRHTQMIRNF